jgi:hypothetical protein
LRDCISAVFVTSCGSTGASFENMHLSESEVAAVGVVQPIQCGQTCGISNVGLADWSAAAASARTVTPMNNYTLVEGEHV